ncbi:kinesin-like protein KIF18B [Hyla sarda]|uniref:kinesin-like protein KIF18B n=1 Tax=Hyla sarda TaxID=327740 RepID=UPI0024C24BB3|nr:kinesin-like protein KIF18B [Hyla sarda]XP_056399246.1 kinesin-like protein KIF18B [Hyla sarda]
MAAPVAAEEGNVSVVVRVRPPNSREQEGNQYSVVQVMDHNILIFDPDEPDTSGVFSNLRAHEGTKRKGKDLKFIFDQVFGEQSSQQDVFEHTTKQILDGVLNGYNCSVFAYGATGAGKTHTMLGSEADPGVMYLTMVELYQRIEAIKEEKSCEVLVSYLEVYNEQIQDLLEPKGSLAIREDPQKGVVVQGLSFHQPKSAKQLLQMLANGNLNRTQHPTDANATSSRSHAVFQIYVKQQDRTASISQDIRMAKMSLIDLAGSERASSTNAKGERLREGANINRSLLALINVINALADAKNKKAHIPYRDSKLTRLLKDSIGGNCRTVMIAAISPSCLSYDDTYNTLKYANRAKEIKLSLKSNVINLDCHISKYAAVCEELKAEVAELKAKLRSYEMKESNEDPTEASSLCQSPVQGKSPSLEEPLDTSSPEQGFKNRLQSLSKLSSEHLHHKRHSKRKKENHDSGSESFESGETDLSILLAPHNHSTEKLVTVLLNLVRKQYAILKTAKLQTPEIDAELQAVECLVARDLGVTDTAQNNTEPKSDVSEEVSNKFLKDEDRHLPSMEDIIPDIKDEEPVVQAPPARKRQPAKRCRRDLHPDISPSLRSPVVPVKRRRQAETNTPSKSSQVPPSTPEVQVKRPRKSAIPSRPNLRSSANLFPSKTTDLNSTSQSKPSRCTPKQASQALPSMLSQTVTKGRVPLGTSALQNSVPAPTFNVKDMNTTFDLSEEGWMMSELDKTVNFGPAEFSGWENIGVPRIDCTFVKSSDIPVFTTNGLSVKGPKSASCASSIKSYSQRRRRSMSASSSRASSGQISQSRIGRVQLSTAKPVQRPPTIAEKISCSPRGQSTKRTGKGTVAFGRSLGGATMSRLMQLASTRT